MDSIRNLNNCRVYVYGQVSDLKILQSIIITPYGVVSKGKMTFDLPNAMPCDFQILPPFPFLSIDSNF